MRFWRKPKNSSVATPPVSTDAATDQVTADAMTVGQLISSGHALEDAGRPSEALAQYLAALRLDANSAQAHLNAGNAHFLLRNNIAAIEMYRRATQLDPASAAAQLNLGTALLLEGISDAAEAAYRQALALNPGMTEAWVGLGCVLEKADQLKEAVTAYARALEIQPGHAGAAANLSDVHVKLIDAAAARQTLCEFLRQHPDNRSIMQKLAVLEQSLGNVAESFAIQRALVEREPHDFAAWSTLIFNSCYLPELSAADALEECRRFGQALESSVPALSPIRPTLDEVSRRLRVGYVSGDFNTHPIANFIHPILRCHDRREFDVFCYHTLNNADRVTADLENAADNWRNVAAADDERIADVIQDDRIDILVDLSGHSGGNRLGVFARKPAPLQYTWLGYLGSTGLTRMDYRLCDAYTDPVGVAEAWQTEVPARMPDSQWCYDQRLVRVPALTPLPRLARGFWTFGSFNNYRKLNERVLTAWAEVLRLVPDSRLKLFSFENRESGERAAAALTSRGIDGRRIDWMLRTSPEDHFESFAEIDVALDSFPYNGATTTCDSLLMGVPVLVVAGDRSLSRGGVSLLNSIGLPDWIADSEQALPALAQRQLASVEAVVRLRLELRARMQASALMDAAKFTRSLEAHYRSTWHRWCQTAARS